MSRGNAKSFKLTNERLRDGERSTTTIELGGDGTSSSVDGSKFSIMS